MKTLKLRHDIGAVAIHKLKDHPRNPRLHPATHDERAVALASLENDYFDPVVWNRRNGMLVSGHFRVSVLRDAGYTHVDAIIVDYPEDVHVARMIAANRQFGAWDRSTLKDLLQEIDTGAFDMAISGFTDADLERMMVDEIPPDPAKTVQNPLLTDEGLSLAMSTLEKAVAGPLDALPAVCRDVLDAWDAARSRPK